MGEKVLVAIFILNIDDQPLSCVLCVVVVACVVPVEFWGCR